ncbi:MAG: transposase family protein, partial [Nitrospirae bacterium]|nr:transposase family protein [Nitrospirota bacterium]
MGLMMKEKKAVTKEVAKRYQKASKKQKGVILNEFIALTGYNRCYASYVLRNSGKRVLVRVKGKIVAVILGHPRQKTVRQRKRIYDEKVLHVLRSIWLISDYICGKRLAPLLKEMIPKLEKFKEIKLEAQTRKKLLRISPATIDRLLAADRKRQSLKGRARTKPGTLLKHQIPIRTFSEWDDMRPGFVEIDLVGHDGGDAGGEFAYTLDLTDVCTGWTETEAIRNRAQKWAFEALIRIQERLPFKLLGLDSDNDGAFINDHLLRYCNEKQITFTRSRPYRKNDNCFVEQKNYSIVRRAVGYLRYDTEEELKILNELYRHLRLYTNFFQPVMKLREKTRIGSRVTKKYDIAKTPYQRLMEFSCPQKETKDALTKQYEM